MIRKLNSNDIATIKKNYKDNPIYKFIFPSSLQLEKEMNNIQFSAEDVFYCCMEYLDRIKTERNGEDILENIWTDVFTNIRRVCNNTNESELNLATCEVLQFLDFLFFCTDEKKNQHISLRIKTQLTKHSDQMFYIMQCIKYEEEHYREMKNPMIEYLNNKLKISEEIETILQQNLSYILKTAENIKQEAKKHIMDVLGIYFISEFRGLGGNFNQLEQTINTLVDNEFNDKEYALIAYKMYHSGKMNSSKPQTFAKWYRIFCDAVECKYNGEYKPSKLKDGKERIDKLFPLL